jgi:D-tyrosyl-tRNA(Tyr) deacylase
MRLLLQRVKSASVSVDQQTIGSIAQGLLVFIGISDTDTEEIVEKMLNKAFALRIFADRDGKTNLALKDVQGELLLVSQFTLYANCRKGNRPSFATAGNPEHAEKLYQFMIKRAKDCGFPVETGSFGADMQVTLVNDGPFTIFLDSTQLFPNA